LNFWYSMVKGEKGEKGDCHVIVNRRVRGTRYKPTSRVPTQLKSSVLLGTGKMLLYIEITLYYFEYVSL